MPLFKIFRSSSREEYFMASWNLYSLYCLKNVIFYLTVPDIIQAFWGE